MTLKKLFLPALLLLSCCSLSAQQTLKTTVGKYFYIGAAMNTNQVWGRDSIGARIAKDNFNSLVAENCMKGEVIHPTEVVFSDEQDLEKIAPRGY